MMLWWQFKLSKVKHGFIFSGPPRPLQTLGDYDDDAEIGYNYDDDNDDYDNGDN